MSSVRYKLVIDHPGPTTITHKATEELVLKTREVFSRYAELLAKEMKFSYEPILHDIGGDLQGDGNWTGVIGMLNRSEMDIGVMPLFMSEERNQAVTYSYPVSVSHVTFVTKKGEYDRNEFGTFLVFNEFVWIAICLAVFLVAFLFYVLQRKKYTFTSVFFNVLGISLLQSGDMKPIRPAGYLLLCSWIIATAFLAMCYTSVLLSTLSVPILKGIRDIPQLAKAVEERRYMCMTLRGSSMPLTLSLSESKAMKLIAANIEGNPNGYGRVEDYIRNSDDNIAYIQAREEISFLHGMFFVSEDSFFSTIDAIAMRKDFCCKDKVNRAVFAITESGFFQKLYRDYDFAVALTEVYSMPAKAAEFPAKLSLRELSGAFVILIAGYVISSLVLCFEIRLAKQN